MTAIANPNWQAGVKERYDAFAAAYVANACNGAMAARIAGYSKKRDFQTATRLVRISYIKEKIAEIRTKAEEWENGNRELCDKLFSERYGACVAKNDNTNAIRCIENKAKNVGYYALDNEQRTEKREMDERQLIEARRIAIVLLTMAPEAIQVDSKAIEGEKDVQRQGKAERGQQAGPGTVQG